MSANTFSYSSFILLSLLLCSRSIYCPNVLSINRLTVDINGDKVTSLDENFIYSTLTGMCVAIFINQIEWLKKDNNWLIKSQVVVQDWAKQDH